MGFGNGVSVDASGWFGKGQNKVLGTWGGWTLRDQQMVVANWWTSMEGSQMLEEGSGGLAMGWSGDHWGLQLGWRSGEVAGREKDEVTVKT
ncbi:hypothetical protein KSP39_PZI002689 [Platanthera zijinensis]|uniref:Uncharacterized protein n=1 Tax=Platanthera zijinensis TaxID=2320716 RepID=A0AAP0C0Y4_9ASPA